MAAPMAVLSSRHLPPGRNPPPPGRELLVPVAPGSAGKWEPVEHGARWAVIRHGLTTHGVPVAEYSRTPSLHVRTFGRESIAACVCRLLNGEIA